MLPYPNGFPPALATRLVWRFDTPMDDLYVLVSFLILLAVAFFQLNILMWFWAWTEQRLFLERIWTFFQETYRRDHELLTKLQEENFDLDFQDDDDDEDQDEDD
jgi:hypothetical protein